MNDFLKTPVIQGEIFRCLGIYYQNFLPLPHEIGNNYFLFQSFLMNDFKIPTLGRCSKRDICPSEVTTMLALFNLKHFFIF